MGTIAIQLAKHLGATVATTVSASNMDLVRSLGADVAINYRREDFTQQLNDYDLVLTSLDGDVLERSLEVLRPGGRLISLSGPPDPAFGRLVKASWILRQIIRAMSWRIRRLAERRGVKYSFLFMRADGAQLADICKLVEGGAIRPIVDQVLPFERTPEIVSMLERSRGPGKLVFSRDEAPTSASRSAAFYPMEDLLTRLRSIAPVDRITPTYRPDSSFQRAMPCVHSATISRA